jgi:adenine C2-methylase RlmN of 23S rRNA A2503 and tRNA A37
VIRAFAGTLKGMGVNVTIRETRGREIDAACGQLRARQQAGKPTVVTVNPKPLRRPEQNG